MNFNKNIKSWMGIFGFFGFLGLLYFKFKNPLHLIFLGLFGLFSFFILGKYSNKKRDELFIYNQNKASNFSLKTFILIIWSGLIFIEIYFFKSLDIANKYSFIVALISITFAITLNLFAFLLYKYETKRLILNNKSYNITTCYLGNYRESLELTQEELAVLVNVRKECIIKIETGQYKPSLELAILIAKVIKKPVEEIFIINELS